MFKLTLTIGGDLLECQGDDVTIATVLPVIAEWLDALPGAEAPVVTRLLGSVTKIDQAADALGEVSTHLDASSPAAPVSGAGPL